MSFGNIQFSFYLFVLSILQSLQHKVSKVAGCDMDYDSSI